MMPHYGPLAHTLRPGVCYWRAPIRRRVIYILHEITNCAQCAPHHVSQIVMRKKAAYDVCHSGLTYH